MEEKIEFWGIIELFGHNQIAGKVSEATIGGQSFVRVDVPKINGVNAHTKFYGNGAIYSMTPVSEEVAMIFLHNHQPLPLNVYMPEIKQLPENDDSSDSPF